MSLSSGTKLGVYEILEPIGAGGMGEVYRARDTTLERDVAIKVLPEEFARDQERLARFEREAKLLASLIHPNIASIHGFEDSGGVKALVLELVDGMTLAERIQQGRIPVDEAIVLARQITEALEAGHEAGVVHRDLKPANIKIKDDGTVKVLDYGLAKALEGDAPATAESELSQSPTLTRQGTELGVILGTAAYMSPEQAKGKRVDKRTDIFAFGSVLFEMLTGRRAFAGDDVSDTLAAVLRAEPKWEALPAEFSSSLRAYLRRCLEKDPKQRVRDIGDVRLALEGAFDTREFRPRVDGARRVGWAVAALWLLLGVFLGLAVWNLRPDPSPTLVRVVATAPSGEALHFSSFAPDVDLAISPDGSRIVYPVSVNGQRQLVVRALDRLETIPIGGVGNFPGIPRGPFISPDGQWVAYFDGNAALRKVSILGGPPVMICVPGGNDRGASWGPDDDIVFATNLSHGLWHVPAGGGEPERLTTPDSESENHVWPEILPGGDAVLFTIETGLVESAQIAVLSRRTGEVEVLIPEGSNPRYVFTGHIVYGVDGTLRAVGFDIERLEVTSDPIPVFDGVVTKPTGAADFAVGGNGSLVYFAGDPAAFLDKTLVWVDREGREEAIAAPPKNYYYPRMSPDGSQVAIDVRDREDDIWVWDFGRETLSRLTFTPQRDRYVAWSPDGRTIAHGTSRAGTGTSLYSRQADGTGSAELLPKVRIRCPLMPFPGGKQLLYREVHPQTRQDLGLLVLDDGSMVPLVATEFSEQNPELSADGRWLAYESDASGRYEVYVRPFPDVDEGSCRSRTAAARGRSGRATSESCSTSTPRVV